MITSEHENVQAFKKARERFDDTADQVAEKMGISKQYLYELLKYPNKNPDKFREACDYIESADVEVPNKFKGQL